MKMIDWVLVIRVNYKKAVILQLCTTAFLSSYKNIILIFPLVREAFLKFLILVYIK